MDNATIELCSNLCRLQYQIKNKKPVACGCNSGHKMEPFSETIVHCHGRHWVMECLVKHLAAVNSANADIIKLLRKRMQKYQQDIAKMRCSGPDCDKPVGRNYRMAGAAAFCFHCSHDMVGGES